MTVSTTFIFFCLALAGASQMGLLLTTSCGLCRYHSIGNVIFQGGKHRVANPTSRFMFHGVGFDIQQARFELKELRERSQGIENDQAMIADILVRHTKLSTEDIEKLFLEAAFIRSIDAKDRGIVDEVTDVHLPPGIPIIQLVFQR
jgi:ATP-dependent protease ClpP protease subunit